MIMTDEDLEITRNVERYFEEQKKKYGVFWYLSIWHRNQERVEFDEIEDISVMKAFKKYFTEETEKILKYHFDIEGKIFTLDGNDYYSFEWTNLGEITAKDMKKLTEEMEDIINEKELQQK